MAKNITQTKIILYMISIIISIGCFVNPYLFRAEIAIGAHQNSQYYSYTILYADDFALYLLIFSSLAFIISTMFRPKEQITIKSGDKYGL